MRVGVKWEFFGFYKFVEPYRCCRCALARFPFITARCERPARLWQKSHRARPQRTAFLLYFAFNSGRQTLAKKKNTNNINTRVTRARTNTYARRSTEISSSGSYDIQTNVLRCPYLFEFLLAETLLVRFSLVFLLCLFVLLPQLIMTNLTQLIITYTRLCFARPAEVHSRAPRAIALGRQGASPISLGRSPRGG